MIVMGELSNSFDVCDCAAKSVKHLANVRAGLHRNDAELVFLVNPHKECLVVVVEDTSAIGPVTVEVASLEETVTLLEEEMVGNELCAVFLFHASQRVELAS